MGNDDNNNTASQAEAIKIIEIGYAHIRQREWNQEFLEKQMNDSNIIHTSLFNEVVKKLEDELIELYGTAVPENLIKIIK